MVGHGAISPKVRIRYLSQLRNQPAGLAHLVNPFHGRSRGNLAKSKNLLFIPILKVLSTVEFFFVHFKRDCSILLSVYVVMVLCCFDGLFDLMVDVIRSIY